jgi:hypothetical protein
VRQVGPGLAAVCALTVTLAGQQQPAELRFDVASVKRSPPYLDRQLQPFAGVPQLGVPDIWTAITDQRGCRRKTAVPGLVGA